MLSGIPLHPLVVHFPIVLAVLLPISVVAALWAVRKGATTRRAWAVPFMVAAGLTLSAWAALQTGEAEEERVEDVVAESVIHGHEEAAERFLVLTGLVTLVAAAGLIGGSLGRGARIVTAAGSLGIVAVGAQVGHSGGVLVYREGAASAYANPAARTGRDIGVNDEKGNARSDVAQRRDDDDRDER
jgi:hypothetical protein